MPPLVWKDVREFYPGALRAERAITEHCTANIVLKISHGSPRPYVLEAAVQCEGKRTWRFTKDFLYLHHAMHSFESRKVEAEMRMKLK